MNSIFWAKSYIKLSKCKKKKKHLHFVFTLTKIIQISILKMKNKHCIFTYTLVGNLIIECVWPEGWIRYRCSYGAIINKAELLHHEELSVPSHTQERYTHSSDILHVNSTESKFF